MQASLIFITNTVDHATRGDHQTTTTPQNDHTTRPQQQQHHLCTQHDTQKQEAASEGATDRETEIQTSEIETRRDGERHTIDTSGVRTLPYDGRWTGRGRQTGWLAGPDIYVHGKKRAQ